MQKNVVYSDWPTLAVASGIDLNADLTKIKAQLTFNL